MAEIDVKIGTGSFDEFDVHIDATWPAVPREGDTVVVDHGAGNSASYAVRGVRYVVGAQDKLIGVQVLVEERDAR